MAYTLTHEQKVSVISALAEGSSIRAVERMTGIHRDTIMRLGVKIGQGCMRVLDETMRDLPCERLELDEIWGYVGKKQRHLTEADSEAQVGDAWTFCAIDAKTKIVPAFKVGKRDNATANAFVADLAGRMAKRVQISTDGLKAYVDAVERGFGMEVDYGQIVKHYAAVESITPERRYSAPEVIAVTKNVISGDPDQATISTSYVERLNATTRLNMKRMNRLTLAFSKKWENFEAAVGLHFVAYNFVRRHSSLRMTPSMAAGVANSFWTYSDLVERAQ